MYSIFKIVNNYFHASNYIKKNAEMCFAVQNKWKNMVSLLRSVIYIQHELGIEDQKQMGKEEEERR